MTDEKFDELYRKNLNNFETIREEIYEKVIGKIVEKPGISPRVQTANIMMNKAYITFASK